MINFRFHLVSITAVFLALAAGITIGAGVVDRATVDQIEGQLSSIRKNREETRAENARLSADLSHWGQFSEQAGDRLVAHHLDGMGIFVLAARGVDGSVVDGLRGSLTAAGARVEGTLWFTSKWNLSAQDDVRDLAAQLEQLPTTRPDDLRAAALSKMATAWASGDSGPFVVGLVDRGFLDFEPGPSIAPTTATSVALAQLPLPSSLFVVLSGDSADVPAPSLALPLVDRLVEVGVPVLAAQPQRKALPKDEAAKLPPEFIPALLTEGQVASKVATVDNADDYRGRVATVLALADLAAGRRGHYGFGDGARVLPDATP
jgi:hypothetical protein